MALAILSARLSAVNGRTANWPSPSGEDMTRSRPADASVAGDTSMGGRGTLGAETLEELWHDEPALIVGPLVVGVGLQSLWHIPAFAEHAAAHGIEPWGVYNAMHYTAFAILLAYAFHGFVCTHVPITLKFQKKRAPDLSPAAAATRNTAILLTELVYTSLPLRPPSSSWLHFLAALAAFTVLWDIEFFLVHKAAHESRWLYTCVHKLHHAIKDPNCFGAYFVWYQSHVLLEQLVVVTCCLAFLPRDVFIFVMYTCTLGTYIEHAGCDVKQLKLPFLPIRCGHILDALLLHAAPLGIMGAGHHDWHHEKFTANYALYFTWLDRLFGTYNPGRKVEDPAVEPALPKGGVCELAEATGSTTLPHLVPVPSSRLQQTAPSLDTPSSPFGVQPDVQACDGLAAIKPISS